MAYARNLPSMAVSAWYHEKVPRAGRSVDQMWNEAIAFAKNEYTAALARGDSLPADEKNRVAERLSSLTGLPTDFILEKNLKLSPQDWLMNILKDKGLRVSNQDTRATGPLVLTAEQALHRARPMDWVVRESGRRCRRRSSQVHRRGSSRRGSAHLSP
jgi:hypothetical protein